MNKPKKIPKFNLLQKKPLFEKHHARLVFLPFWNFIKRQKKLAWYEAPQLPTIKTIERYANAQGKYPEIRFKTA